MVGTAGIAKLLVLGKGEARSLGIVAVEYELRHVSFHHVFSTVELVDLRSSLNSGV